MKRTLILIVAALALGAFAYAQQGGGQRGQGGRGQRQAGGGGQRQGGGSGQRQGGGGQIGLLAMPKVQTELNLTASQKTEIAKLAPQRGQGGRRSQGGQAGEAGQGQRGQGGQGGQRAELEAKIAELLDDKQEARLAELVIQRAGNRAVFNEKVATQLELTADQKKKIADLRASQRQAQQTLSRKTQSQEMTREEAREARAKNETILDEELGKVLTEVQKAKLKELGGAPFSF